MIKKLGLSLAALAASVVFFTPAPAKAADVRFGVYLGGPRYVAPAPVYPDPYAYGYVDPYYASPYVNTYVQPYTYYNSWGHRDREHWRHEMRERQEHMRHEMREHHGDRRW